MSKNEEKKENRCIVTLDLDFANILRYPADEMSGIIVIRPNRPICLPDLESFAKQLIVELKKQNPKNCLWVLEPHRLRIRKPEE